ncbi:MULTISPECIES: hypothetical protein [Flavobacteriaceae]|uniref:hypothetical protein n=1 Tax=Flavobacteriaceae TaxID=49546 RepID=UPI0014930A05|nr:MULTISPECIES: hypothetical protein [Allomuricauda]MDC6364784.1 hypothetical protein [Muricauda sp. AC10]
MKSKIKTFPILATMLFSVCLLVQCTKSNQQKEKLSTGNEIVETLDQLFDRLSSIDTNQVDSIIHIDEQIRKVVEQISSPKLLEEIHQTYKTERHDYTLAYSNDGSLGVFSWKTRLNNGAMSSIKNIALYENDGKLIPTSLYGKPIVYKKIHSQSSAWNKQVYILSGGFVSENDTLQRVNSYHITKNGLEEAYIFKNRTWELTLDTTEIPSNLEAYLAIPPKKTANNLYQD